jgi:hypothetical protein
MQFTEQFRSFVSDGDSIDVEINGIVYRATIKHDPNAGSPDDEQDGFWPSLKPDDPGFIGHKSRRTFGRALERAKEIMRAWQADEWMWCGVVISAHLSVDEYDHDTDRFEVDLSDHCASLWRVECNYPVFNKRDVPNAYLNTIANELLSEAVDVGEHAAKAMLERLSKRGSATA